MSKAKKGRKTGLFIFLCIGVFLASFLGSAVFKLTYQDPRMKKYSVNWSQELGTIDTDLPYGNKPANQFDLYLPADGGKEAYGLVVFLHAGGFTSGDKSDDAGMLQWLCSKGYVAAGINYTLFSEKNPNANIYTQSMEIKQSIPVVIREAEKRGYPIDRMAMAGGSAGGCLALLYAYRDAAEAPVPVRMVFEGVGPSSFYPEDWKSYGLDGQPGAAAALFGVMAGKEIPADLLGTPKYDEAIKDISALLWVDENTVPTVMAYGVYDKLQPYEGAVRLNEALNAHHVPHEFIVFPHSGHGLQNDNRQAIEYYEKICEYLDRYMSE